MNMEISSIKAESYYIYHSLMTKIIKKWFDNDFISTLKRNNFTLT